MPRRKIEPWPVAVGVALLFMISVCLGFWAIARTHPDAVLSGPTRPGLEP